MLKNHRCIYGAIAVASSGDSMITIRMKGKRKNL